MGYPWLDIRSFEYQGKVVQKLKKKVRGKFIYEGRPHPRLLKLHQGDKGVQIIRVWLTRHLGQGNECKHGLMLESCLDRALQLESCLVDLLDPAPDAGTVKS